MRLAHERGALPPPSPLHQARHRRRNRHRPARDVATPQTLKPSRRPPLDACPRPCLPIACWAPHTDVALGARPLSLAAPLAGSDDHRALPVAPARTASPPCVPRLARPRHRCRGLRRPLGRGRGAGLPHVAAARLEAPATGLPLFPLWDRSAARAASRGGCTGHSKRSRAPCSGQPLRVGRIHLALRLRGRSPALQSLLQSPIALAVGSATSVADTPFRADRRRVSPAVPRGSSRRFASSLCAASPCEACFRFHCVRTSKTGPGDRA